MKIKISIILLFLIRLLNANNLSVIDSLKSELKEADNKAKILNLISENYLNILPQDAILYADKAINYASKKDDKIELGNAYWYKARAYLILNNYDLSNGLVDSARQFFKETERPENVVNCEVMKASTLMLQGKYDEALELFESTAKESEKLEAWHINSSIHLNMGRIYRARGDFEKALENYQTSLNTAKEISHQFLIANAYFFIGELYQDKQKMDLAIENFLKALPLYEENGFFAQIPYLYSAIGVAYRENKNYKESLAYFNKAKAYFQQTNDRWGLNELYGYIGSTYMEMDYTDSALVYFESSLKISQEIDDKAAECNAWHNLGDIHISNGEFDEAIDHIEKALSINQEIKNDFDYSRILLSKGICLAETGNPKEGLKVFRESLLIADSLNFRTESMLANKYISKVYKKLKQYDKALQHYERYSELNDSIYTEESNKHFVEMERKYQSEKQKKEISQLRLDKMDQEVIIRKQRSVRNILILGVAFVSVIGLLLYRGYKAKQKANLEKDALLKEIHHRVKNNLQIISSLLTIQTENITDSKVISAVKESQSRVKAMALIHQLLYQDKDITRIDFSSYLPQLVNTVSSIFKKEGTSVISEVEAKNIAFDIDTAIPLGLIVAELVANAFKYAFNGHKEGKVKIEINNNSGNEYTLSVADNGIGLPNNMRIDELSSMGLRLVNILTAQLDGQFSYEFRNGAHFTVKFTDRN